MVSLKRFLFLAFFCTGLLIHAQDSTRVFYNAKGDVITPPFASSFCDYVKDSTGLYLGTEYYLMGNLKSASYYEHASGGFYLTGKYLDYYNNKAKRSEGIYFYNNRLKLSIKAGRWKYYYPDGKKSAEWVYKINNDSMSSEEVLMNYWDTTGAQRVNKGKGYYTYTADINTTDSVQRISFSGKIDNGKYDSTWTSHYEDGKIFAIENYKDGILKKGKSYDSSGKENVYDTLTVGPSFPGGDTGILNFLIANIHYPTMERDNDIQGRVLVRFIVTKYGFVSSASIVRGVSPGLDYESLRVVKLLPNFIPGKERGQAVDTYFNFPISFKLQ